MAELFEPGLKERGAASEAGHDTGETVVGVSELIAELRRVLAGEFGELWVEGEIASLHRSRPGHLYFDLKDESGQLRCAMFRRAAEAVAFEVEEGMQVRAWAHPDVYSARGTLQLIVEELKPAGEGALRMAFERLKRRLFDEGLFDPENKRTIPDWPARIGVVTSAHGAAIHDLVRGLRRRRASAELVLRDARVQGESAWRELVRGLHLLDADPSIEVIVLTRGGGSIEDLWNFNREEVVRAIFELETPVISAIGHEVDLVLTDLAADARASTPTAAADLIAPDGDALDDEIRALERRLVDSQRRVLENVRGRLEGLRRGLVHPASRLAQHAARLRELGERIVRASALHVQARAAALDALCRNLELAATTALERREGRLRALSGRLDALSPLAVLGRGFALARRSEDGAILRQSSDAPAGTSIDLTLARGRLRAQVLGEIED